MKTQKLLVVAALLFAFKGHSQTYSAPLGAGTGGAKNVFIGNLSGSITTGNDNSFLGNKSGQFNEQGYSNTFFGSSAGLNNKTGAGNVFVGANSGLMNNANNNSFFGVNAGNSNLGGSANVYMGYEAGQTNTSGTRNIFIGLRAGASTVGGEDNVALGWGAGGSYTGGNNIAIGRESGTSIALGSRNITFGINAGKSVEGDDNILMGNGSGLKLKGDSNIMLGATSGKSLNIGGGNIFMGLSSGSSITDGSGNLFFGNSAGGYMAAGSNNIVIGNGSGRDLVGGSNNTILGYLRVAPNSTLSNTIILADGNTGKPKFYIAPNGDTGIGLEGVIPQNRLEIKSATANSSGLRFTNLNGTFMPGASVIATKFLTVNNSGDVVLQNIPSTSAGLNIYNSNGTLTENRTVTMENKSMIFDTGNDGRIYIGHDSPAFNTATFPTTTGNYRLYVEGGILTEKAKVALKSTANWADDVFAEDHTLMPLHEIKSFIEQNNHLPGIESAEELVKNGLDLGSMQAKQMEKIEELTLYIIQQNKDIETLKAQMKILMERK